MISRKHIKQIKAINQYLQCFSLSRLQQQQKLIQTTLSRTPNSLALKFSTLLHPFFFFAHTLPLYHPTPLFSVQFSTPTSLVIIHYLHDQTTCISHSTLFHFSYSLRHSQTSLTTPVEIKRGSARRMLVMVIISIIYYILHLPTKRSNRQLVIVNKQYY